MKALWGVCFLAVFAGCKSRQSKVMDQSNNSNGQFTNWLPNEPNNNGNEDCVVAVVGGGWRDIACTDSKFFACQSKSNPTKWDIDANRGEWKEHGDRCKDGYVFAAPQSANDVLNLNDAMGDDAVWINLTDQKQEGVFESGGEGDDSDSGPGGSGAHQQTFFNWSINEPNNENNEDCGIQITGGRWRDFNCSDSKFFACQSVDNPEEWDIDAHRGTWDEGKNKCKDGFKFAAPQNAQDVLNLNNYMGDDAVWINITDKEQEGKWMTE